ncbi:hypothetical protein ACHAXT_010147 [Thalassiosira profunda]
MNGPSPPSRPGLALTAVPRPPETDGGNLFVRLGPQTARRLASLLPASPSDDPAALQLEPSVDFIPLEIVFRGAHRHLDGGEEDLGDEIAIYASYNGGAPASPAPCPSRPYNSSCEDIVELPFDLHPSLRSIFDAAGGPVVVSVRPLSDVPVGESVTFQPLTVSDWEMIETEASVLEDGGLLNQITVVSPGQMFPLRFGGQSSLESAAWIKVADKDFGVASNQRRSDSCSDESAGSFLSDSDWDSSDDEEPPEHIGALRHRCVRLMAETEVEVIPKPRRRSEGPAEEDASSSDGAPVYIPSLPLRVQPISADVTASASLPDLALGAVCVNRETLMQLPGYQQCRGNELNELSPAIVTVRKVSGPHARESPQDDGKESGGSGCDVAVATIYPSGLTRKGHIGIHALLRCQLGIKPLSDWVSVQIWSEPRVMASVHGQRTRKEEFRVATIATNPLSTKPPLALEPWRSMEGYNAALSGLNNNIYTTCEYCRQNNNLVGSDDASKLEGVRNPAPLFSSGSLIPADFLQSPGVDGLGDHCNHSCILKIQSTADSAEDSSVVNDTSRLVPIVTLSDLKELLSDSDLQTDGTEHDFEPLAYSDGSAVVETIGFSTAIQSVQQSIRQIIPLAANEIFSSGRHLQKRAIMVTGDEGSGKTHLALTSAWQLSSSDMCAVVYLNCKKLQAASTSIQFILEELQKAFREAWQKQPSVIVLDDLDALVPNVESSGAEGDGSIHHHQLNPALITQVKILVDHLLMQSQSLCGSALICTCRDKDSISSRYQASGLFHSLIEVPSLDTAQRTEFLYHNIIRDAQARRDKKVPHAISQLGKDTDGFRPKDLRAIANQIVQLDYLRHFDNQVQGGEQCSGVDTLEGDVASILEDYAPLSQQVVDIDRTSSTMEWASIGGLFRAKQALHETVIHPMKFKAVYDRAPIALPRGLLVYGPPGNGKSFVVPLLAKKSKLNLITCRGPELLDRYIGASEAKVRQIFARATAAAPALIFFDEFDSLAPQRGSDHTGVTDRVVNQLLTLLDGAERSKKASHIFVVAATSRPDKIDKALLRPGRLERHVYVGFSESLSEWNDLFSSILETRKVDAEVSELQQTGDLFNHFCKGLDYARDFSAADMKAVLDTAHLLCVHEMLDANASGDRVQGPAVLTKRHIVQGFRRTRPSLLPRDRQVLQRIYKSFGMNEASEDLPGASQREGLKTALR